MHEIKWLIGIKIILIFSSSYLKSCYGDIVNGNFQKYTETEAFCDTLIKKTEATIDAPKHIRILCSASCARLGSSCSTYCYNPTTGTCITYEEMVYALNVGLKQTHALASATCTAQGLWLVTPRSAAAFQTITAKIPQLAAGVVIWTGYVYNNMWMNEHTGIGLTYTYFYPGEPNNPLGEPALQMYGHHNGMMNDGNPAGSVGVMCQNATCEAYPLTSDDVCFRRVGLV